MHVNLPPDRMSNIFPTGMDSICNEYQYYQKPSIIDASYPSINLPLLLWRGDRLDGAITVIGSPQNMNTGGIHSES